METRIAVIGIIVANKDSVESVNELLNIISVVVDAPQDIISALSGKLGRLQGINSKALYSNIGS